jgi:hypothetical protein
VSDLLSDKTPIKARHIRPGQGQAVEMKTGQLLQIQTLQGKQVADFVAFTTGDTGEYVSTSATRATNSNIIPQQGMTLYSNRRQPMFEIVEDTVGRHDMLYACCDPVRYELLGAPGHASCREALVDSLRDYGIGYDRIPSPINWFMNVSIMQRGELELREPLAEQGDYVVLRALKDVIAAVSACPQDLGPTNAFNPTDLSIRVYRDEPLPVSPEMVGVPPIVDEADAAVVDVVDQPDVAAVEVFDESAPISANNVVQPENPSESEAAVAPELESVEAAAPVAAVPTAQSGRLQDTVEGTVVRVENGSADRTT